jgi:hypothetical protein
MLKSKTDINTYNSNITKVFKEVFFLSKSQFFSLTVRSSVNITSNIFNYFINILCVTNLISPSHPNQSLTPCRSLPYSSLHHTSSHRFVGHPPHSSHALISHTGQSPIMTSQTSLASDILFDHPSSSHACIRPSLHLNTSLNQSGFL